MKIKVELLRDGAQYPKYGRDLDVGADIYLPENVALEPGMNKVPLGLAVHIPQGFEGQIRPRSDTLLRGITVHNPPIDPGYTGEIHALVESIEGPIDLKKGERICQLVIAPVIKAVFVDNIANTRGDNGFNSTGK